MSEKKLNLKNIKTVKDLIKQINFDDYFYFTNDEQINLRQFAYNITKRCTILNNIQTHTPYELDALSCLITGSMTLVKALSQYNDSYPDSTVNPEVINEIKALLHSLIDDLFTDITLKVNKDNGHIVFQVHNSVFGIINESENSSFKK